MIISIDGLPGCRKNEIYQALKKHLGMNVLMCREDRSSEFQKLHRELVDDPNNTYTYEINRVLDIKDRIADNEQDSLGRSGDRNINSVVAVNNSGFIVDSLYSLRHIYLDFFRDSGNLTNLEYQTVGRVFDHMNLEPQVIIYLFGTFENTLSRMRDSVEHNKEDEISFNENEFKKLHYQFEWVFDINNCQIPIYKVSVEDDLDSIVRNIAEILRRIEILF